MGVPKKHHTKSKVGRRRSHQHLKPAGPMLCPNCKAPVLSHRACSNCGAYGRLKVKEAATPEEEADD
ncbi:MAG: 50S ribosomal protein L32 [Candidatus Colwellbacteria bacterium]